MSRQPTVWDPLEVVVILLKETKINNINTQEIAEMIFCYCEIKKKKSWKEMPGARLSIMTTHNQ